MTTHHLPGNSNRNHTDQILIDHLESDFLHTSINKNIHTKKSIEKRSQYNFWFNLYF